MTDELRKLAKAATPGPWAQHGNLRGNAASVVNPKGEAELGNWFVAGTQWPEDAAYIAAASPDVVLGLLDEVDRLRRLFKEGEDARFDLDQLCRSFERGAMQAATDRDEAYAAVRRLAGALDDYACDDPCPEPRFKDGVCCRAPFGRECGRTAREALSDTVVRRIVEGG